MAIKKQNKIEERKYNYLITVSLAALATFFICWGQIRYGFFGQPQVAGVVSHVQPLLGEVKTNNDPLITKAGDYYFSFIRAGDPVIAGQGKKALIFCDFLSTDCALVWQKLLAEKEQSDLEIIWKNFPKEISAEGQTAMAASICASQQNKFKELADLMFANQAKLSTKMILKLAAEAGLVMENFSSCLESMAVIQLLGQDLTDGQNLMIDQVPYLFINNTRVESNELNELDKILANERF